MKIFYLTILFAYLSLATLPAKGRKVYISPLPRTAVPDGSVQAPFSTIEEALSALSAGKEESAELILLDGDHFLSEGIRLSGNTCPVKELTIKALNLHKAVLRLDKPLAGYLKPVTDDRIRKRVRKEAADRIREIDLEALGIRVETFPERFKARENFPQLIYQEELLPLSRYPNEGYLYMKKVLDNFGNAERGGIFEYDDPRHGAWTEALPSGVWFTGYWRIPWQAWTVKIQEIDTVRCIVTQAVGIETENGKDVGIFGGIGSKYDRPSGSGKENYYVENLIEEIDRPGEWCVDFTTHKIYFLPPESFDERQLSLVSHPATLFDITGMKNLKLEGIILKNHLGDGIRIAEGEKNLIAGCSFRNILGNAVSITGGKEHRVQSSDFSHIGRTCIEVSGGDRPSLQTCGHSIDNNYFTRFGEIQQSYAPAVKVGFYETGIGIHEGNAVGIKVSHNLVHNAPHAAFIYGGNLNVLEYNEVFDIARKTGDVGAFYARWDWTSRGNVVRNNFIHHIPRANAIYGDDGHAGDSIYNNVVYRALVGTIIGGGHYNYISHNLYAGCTTAGINIDARGKQRNYNAGNPDFADLFRLFRIPEGTWDNRFPGISTFLECPHLELPQENEISDNIFIDCKEGVRKEGQEDDFRYSRIGKNNCLQLPAPDFDGVILHKDLKRIPEVQPDERYELKKCGLYTDHYRTVLPDRKQLLDSIGKQEAGFDSLKDQQTTNRHF